MKQYNKEIKNKVSKILIKLREKNIIKEIHFDDKMGGYIFKEENQYIEDKFESMGITSYPLVPCDLRINCDIGAKNVEDCPTCPKIYTFVEIPTIKKEDIIDEIFKELGDE